MLTWHFTMWQLFTLTIIDTRDFVQEKRFWVKLTESKWYCWNLNDITVKYREVEFCSELQLIYYLHLFFKYQLSILKELNLIIYLAILNAIKTYLGQEVWMFSIDINRFKKSNIKRKNLITQNRNMCTWNKEVSHLLHSKILSFCTGANWFYGVENITHVIFGMPWVHSDEKNIDQSE